MIPRSLNARLLLSVSILLIAFFGVTVVVLDYFFRDLSMHAISDRLEVESLVLMAAADEQQPGKLVPVPQQLDVRFMNPNSGLYGEITDGTGVQLWRSQSLLGNQLELDYPVRPGQKRLESRRMSDGSRVLVLSVGLSWEFANHQSRSLIFSVAESEEPYFKRLSDFRWRLLGGFAVMGALLVLSLLWLMRSVLTPLRKVQAEIAMIENGTRQLLSEDYPRELVGVAANMNALLHHERERMTRYRNTLGNLAHSLKTPLAVIRNLLTSQEKPDVRKMDEQLMLMDDLVRYQLKRAAASAGVPVGAAPVALADIVTPLRETLEKVYIDKQIRCEASVEAECKLHGDKNDLMEIVGNLLDNAFKYARSTVRISAETINQRGVIITVEDDGPGIPVAQRQQVLLRGMRLDEQQSGQGIGLSVVNELVNLYHGSIVIEQSSLGGARIVVSMRGV